jgi:predicted Zn-dependent protease
VKEGSPTRPHHRTSRLLGVGIRSDMKLSEQPEYLLAIPAAVIGDYPTARQNLRILITRAEDERDTITLCYLLQRLGDIEAKTGNPELGHSLHKQAIDIDSGSPFSLFTYANSLFDVFKSPDLALASLNELEKMLNSGQWKPDEHDLSKEWYEKNIIDVRYKINKFNI